MDVVDIVEVDEVERALAVEQAALAGHLLEIYELWTKLGIYWSELCDGLPFNLINYKAPLISILLTTSYSLTHSLTPRTGTGGSQIATGSLPLQSSGPRNHCCSLSLPLLQLSYPSRFHRSVHYR